MRLLTFACLMAALLLATSSASAQQQGDSAVTSLIEQYQPNELMPLLHDEALEQIDAPETNVQQQQQQQQSFLDTSVQTENEAEAEAETETESNTEAESQSEADLESEVDAVTEAADEESQMEEADAEEAEAEHDDALVESESESESEAESESESESDATVDVEVDADAVASAEQSQQIQTEVDQELDVDNEAEADSESESDAESETEAEVSTSEDAAAKSIVNSISHVEDYPTMIEAAPLASVIAAPLPAVQAVAEQSTEITSDSPIDINAHSPDEVSPIMTPAKSQDYVVMIPSSAKKLAAAQAAAQGESDWNEQVDENGRSFVTIGGQVRVKGSCGSGWSSYIVPEYKFTPACDHHDVCYDVCAKDLKVGQEACDAAFKKDMDAICAQLYNPADRGFFANAGFKFCDSNAQIYVGAVRKFGQGPYAAAQKKAGCKY